MENKEILEFLNEEIESLVNEGRKIRPEGKHISMVNLVHILQAIDLIEKTPKTVVAQIEEQKESWQK